MDNSLSPSLILGLDKNYNKSDAIDSYNSLTLWYKNNTSLSEEEKLHAINLLDISIKNIIDSFLEQKSFNEQFNKDFLVKYSKQTNKFGYIEKII